PPTRALGTARPPVEPPGMPPPPDTIRFFTFCILASRRILRIAAVGRSNSDLGMCTASSLRAFCLRDAKPVERASTLSLLASFLTWISGRLDSDITEGSYRNPTL
ncbi:unnamed protein product, partial [Ixodes pacificus]